jgi:polyribonucleotide 5'-hydroxyl-kinase
VDDRPELLKHLITSLSERVNSLNSHSGVIIDTFPCGAGPVPSYESIVYAARAFDVDHVFVIEQDRTYNDLKRELAAGGSKAVVTRLSKSGGVVSHEANYVKYTERQTCRDYFYGKMRDLCPRPIILPFAQLFLYETVSTPPAPRDALPIGAVAAPREVEYVRVVPDESLERRILGVSGEFGNITSPLTASQMARLSKGNCRGFVHVQKVDMANGRLTLLMPNSVGMPSNVLIVGNVNMGD